MNTRSGATATTGRLAEVHLAASLCLTALTVATVISLCRIFPDWAYLQPMVAVAVGVHFVAIALRYARAPLWAALPALVLVLFLLLGLVYYRDTLSMFLPTSRTVELMRIDLRLVIDQFATAVAPVPSEGSFVTATAAAIGVCAMLADVFAFRAFGRVEAIVPTGVLFVFTSALGTDRHRIAVAALWIGAALLTIAMLRFAQSGEDSTWMGSRRLTLGAAFPAIVITIAFSAIAAGAVAPHLPGAGQEALIDTRNRDGSVTEVLSPLVDIRARLKKNGNSELFTVQSDNGGHYWRVVGLPNFNGNEWSPPDEDLFEMGDRSSEVILPGASVRQVITIKSLRGPLLPAAFQPTQVAPDRVLWADESQSLVLNENNSLDRGEVFLVGSIVAEPSADQLRAATVSGAPSEIYYQLPSGFPGAARATAIDVTAGAATPFDQALTLQNWFRDTNNFTYDTDVQYGNSNDAIDAFLRDRRGFCQQFAGTFAAMARSLGLPARVAVGYTPGDLGNDGLFHVYGRHAHAWPEIWFDNIGWIAFEPTPGRGNADTSAYNGVDAAQDDTRGGGAVNPGTVPVPTVVRDPGSTTTGPGQGRPGGAPSTTARAGGAISSPSGGSGSSLVPMLLLGGVVLLVLWILLAPRLFAMFAHGGARTARDRVVTSWARACRMLSMAGAPPVGGATPMEYANQVDATTGVDTATVRELAVQVTRAVYSPVGVDDRIAERCETLEAEVDAMCRTRIPFALRIRSLIDPRMIRTRASG